MLEFAAILTTGGLLLFSSAFELDKSILLTLINRIIDSKNLESNFTILKYKISYLYDAVLGLIFVIGWRKQILFDYPQKLLQAMSLQWKNIYEKIMWKENVLIDGPDFKEVWQKAFQIWKRYVSEKEEKGNVMKTFHETEKGVKVNKKKDQENKNKEGKDKESKDKESKDKESKDDKSAIQKKQQAPASPFSQPVEIDNIPKQQITTIQQLKDQTQNLTARQRLLKAQKQKNSNKSPKNLNSKKSPGKQSEKERRTWQGGKINKNDLEDLDFSKKNDRLSENIVIKKSYEEEKQQKIDGFLDSDEEIDQTKQSKFFHKWIGKVKNIVGDKKITQQDINEVMGQFSQKLMEKNVAQDVAQKISEAVGKTLIETKTKSFTTVQATVKQALQEALKKILTPKKKIDLILQIKKQKQKLKPYVIVFIGVNGVGKSTNLAKVAYKLKNAKLSVLLAACDNFRAGAVQQIKTHGRNLDIPVFDRGYKEQPSSIAFEAIRDATKKHIDVVLIDTAGRMQDNQPLMKELAQIVKVNKPNLVIFIGEALVGNDAVDQITKFNKVIEQESTDTYKSEINAILLSKFDTVDDKVGTALSLVYSTGKPILFVGVGQRYQNLKQLNVKTVVHSLLS